MPIGLNKQVSRTLNNANGRTINTHTGRTRSDLDPLIWSQVRDGDCKFRLVQQNLYLGAAGVLAGTDANWDHPVGAVLT